MTQRILIASSSLDSEVCRSVIAALRRQGHDPIFYESDKVAAGVAPLHVRFDASGKPRFYYQDQLFSRSTIAAAWYRRPSLFGLGLKDAAYQLSMDDERRAMQDAIWELIPKRAWLNSPEANRRADHKIIQLQRARRVGFKIPATVVSNRWGEIKKLPAPYIVLKMQYGILRTRDADKELYTTVLKNDASLPTATIPFPGIWQAYVPKKREWRVTVVGDKVFAAAIYTEPEAKDDWRKHQDGNLVRFRVEPFPAELGSKCVTLLRRLGLRFGAFDFIETPEGEIIFLEVNPNGQYGWLEDELGFPISAAIAEELARIAARSR